MPAYKDTSNNTWYCKFNYKDWKGERHTKFKRGFTTKREAAQYERSFLDKMANSPTTLFKHIVEAYMQDIKSSIKDGELKEYSYKMRTYQLKRIQPYFDNMPINEITPEHIRQWQIEELADLKPATKKTYLVFLGAIFNFACTYYQLQKNPCTIKGKTRKAKQPQKPVMQIWTISQFKLFIEALLQRKKKQGQKHPAQYYAAFFNLLFYSGCRIGEALALTVGDFVGGNIYISKSRNPYNEITPPKTDKANRCISLPQTVVELLEKHISSLQDNSTTAPLFPKLSRLTVAKLINDVSPLANIPVIRIHDIRHSHASMLINANVQPLLISERLGHENIQTTLNIYSHLYRSTTEQISSLIEDLMNKN